MIKFNFKLNPKPKKHIKKQLVGDSEPKLTLPSKPKNSPTLVQTKGFYLVFGSSNL